MSSSTTRSRRRAAVSSSSTSSSSARLAAKKRVVGVPVALDQRVADEQLAGELRVDPAVGRRCGRRRSARRRASPARSRRPRPACVDQCGSRYVRLTRCSASGSTHSGSIRATVRAHSREVSTSSAAITQSRRLLARAASRGRSRTAPPRAPRYSRVSALAQARCGEAGRRAARRWIAVRVGRRRRSSVIPAVARGPAQLARAGPATRGSAGSAGTRSRSSLRNWLPESAPLLLAEVAPEVEEGEEVRAVVGEARRAWRRPPARCSAGRSRGSWIDSAAAMTSTSRRQPVRSASSTMRPRRGSTGSGDSARPTAVSVRCRRAGRARRAPRAARRRRATARGRAGRRTGTRRCRRGRARSSAGSPRRGWCAGSRGR